MSIGKLGKTSSLVKEFNPEFGTNCKDNGKKNRYKTDRCSSQMDRALDLSPDWQLCNKNGIEKWKIILKYAVYLISRFKGWQFVKCTTLNLKSLKQDRCYEFEKT